MDFIRKEKLCNNCLRKNHFAKRCRFTAACMMSDCSKRHHSLLHPPASTGNEPQNPEEVSGDYSSQHSNEAGNTGNCGATAKAHTRVCLRIVPVKVCNPDRTREVETYAFIDNGSDTTLCTKSLVEELNLPSKPAEFTLTTVNDQNKRRFGQEVELNVRALSSHSGIRIERVWTVERLPISERSIPTVDEINRWPHLHNIKFPKLDHGRVTILIGSDVPEAHWIFEERRGRPKEPLAARTLLGWTLLGPVGNADNHEANVNFVHADQETITSQVERLYNAEFSESSGAVEKSMSVEDRRALAIMETSVRQVKGHYQIALPWCYKVPCLPNNKSMAERRLHLLQKRLKKDESLSDEIQRCHR